MFVFLSSLHVENLMPKVMVVGGKVSGKGSGHEGRARKRSPRELA